MDVLGDRPLFGAASDRELDASQPADRPANPVGDGGPCLDDVRCLHGSLADVSLRARKIRVLRLTIMRSAASDGGSAASPCRAATLCPSPGRAPGIQEDGPFDHLARNLNAGPAPRVVPQQSRCLPGIPSFEEKRAHRRGRLRHPTAGPSPVAQARREPGDQSFRGAEASRFNRSRCRSTNHSASRGRYST